MSKWRRRAATISVVTVILVILSYTMYSSITEPHSVSPSVTKTKAYTAELANQSNVNIGDPASLVYHTFSLAHSNATFGFFWTSSSPNIYWNGIGTTQNQQTTNLMGIWATKVNQSIGFPYSGTFLIEPITANITIEFSGTTYYFAIPQPNYLQNPPAQLINNSYAGYYFLYQPTANFTTIGNYTSPPTQFMHINSYNLTYRIEVKPMVEWGQYYVTGTPVWVSHTFEYPYS